MEKATIYDYARFTQVHCSVDDECAGCPLNNLHCELENADSEELTKINEIILNWCKEHPIKTRQSEFLKMFPNVTLIDDVINICPNIIDIQYDVDCDEISCDQCKKEYWLAEVDENE